MKNDLLKQNIREEIQMFMEHHEVLTKLEGMDWYSVEDALVELLTNDTRCRTYVGMSYDRYCHEEDARSMLVSNEIEPTKESIEIVTDMYEHYMENDDSWYCDLNDAMYDFMTKKGIQYVFKNKKEKNDD